MKLRTASLVTLTALTLAANPAAAEGKKNRWVAAGLNFVLPGTGYAYNGEKPLYVSLPLIAGSVGLTYLEQVHKFDDGKRLMDHDRTAFGVMFAAVFIANTALAIDAYREADEINKRTDPSELRAWRLDLRPVRSENATGYSVLLGRSF